MGYSVQEILEHEREMPFNSDYYKYGNLHSESTLTLHAFAYRLKLKGRCKMTRYQLIQALQPPVAEEKNQDKSKAIFIFEQFSQKRLMGFAADSGIIGGSKMPLMRLVEILIKRNYMFPDV
jgi:hypothetical protein